MTRSEREDLARLVRKQTTVAKSGVDKHAAAMKAEFERRLATIFEAHDELWRDITATANAGVRKLDALLRRRCLEAGVDEDFRPSLHVSWHGRGVNASRERRAELVRVNNSQIESRKRDAYAAIEAEELRRLTALASDALESEASRAFLAALPPPEALFPPLPPVDVLELTRCTPAALRERLETLPAPAELAALLEPPGQPKGAAEPEERDEPTAA